jgi:hypothetical protein
MVFRSNLWPYWYEVVTVTWYAGLLLAELTNPGAKGEARRGRLES